MTAIPINNAIPPARDTLSSPPIHVRDRHPLLPFFNLVFPGLRGSSSSVASSHKLGDAARKGAEIFRGHVRGDDARQGTPNGDQTSRVRDEQDGVRFGSGFGIREVNDSGQGVGAAIVQLVERFAGGGGDDGRRVGMRWR